jgi:hypothetical protein
MNYTLLFSTNDQIRRHPDRSRQRTYPITNKASETRTTTDPSLAYQQHQDRRPRIPSHQKYNVKQQNGADRRRQSPKTHNRVLVTLRARRRGADNQKSGAEPARARRSGPNVVSRQQGRPTSPAVGPSAYI